MGGVSDKAYINNYKPDGNCRVYAMHFTLLILFILLGSISFPDCAIAAKERNKSISRPSLTIVPALAKPSSQIKETLPKWRKELVQLYDTVSIIFVGDVMQHGVQIRNAHIPGTDMDKISSYNYTYAFKYFKERFKRADLAVANMEFPVGLPPYSGYPQFSAPTAIVNEAIESGIGLFCIANNHILDKGRAGIERSLSVYDEFAGESHLEEGKSHKPIYYTGAYANDSTEYADNPRIVDLKGVKVAFINFTYGTNGFSTPAPFVVNRMDSTKVKEVIARAKERGAQMIIAMPHWGAEYELYPGTKQKEWAKMLFNNGVRIIIGSHPHVPQTAELYLNNTLHPRKYGEIEKMVFYSLGNYISNQSIPDYTQLGMLVEIKIIKNNLNGEITLSRPDFEYIWCFKKNEFAPYYTVVPVNDFIGKPELVKSKEQYKRMIDTYNYIKNKDLVKEIH